MSNESENLKLKIFNCKKKLKELKPLIEKSDSASAMYNKIMIEKAILVDELKKKQQNVVQKIFKKLTLKKEKMIDDYFK